MKDVVFEPFEGMRYKQNEWGLRVLVLGESHNHDGTEATSGFTERVVKDFIYNKFKNRRRAFFTKVAKVLLGIETNGSISDDDRAKIWEQIAFYNYIQSFVGDKARISPTDEMWAAAKSPFLSVLAELKPDVVLVLGVNLWNHLQPLPEGPVFCRIKHPSTGFSYQEWTPKFVEALNKAREKQL